MLAVLSRPSLRRPGRVRVRIRIRVRARARVRARVRVRARARVSGEHGARRRCTSARHLGHRRDKALLFRVKVRVRVRARVRRSAPNKGA